MNKEVIINVPKIQKEIKKRHQKFIGEFDAAIQKVVADKRLLTDVIVSRLYRIVICFQQEGIIDMVQIHDQYPKKLTLRKNGFDNYVHIITNGHMIRIEGFVCDFDDFISDMVLPGKNYRNTDEEDYNWIEFALELLDYIHLSIYGRKEALEVKINGMLKSPVQDDIKIEPKRIQRNNN